MSSSVPETTRTLVHEAEGQGLVIKQTQTTTSVPSGTALVRILSAAVRPHNKAGFEGKKALPFPTPYTPGNSAVGRILAVGNDAVSLRPGQLIWANGYLISRDDPEQTQTLLGLTDLGGGKPGTLFNAWPGVWSDVASLPLENCVPLNEDILCNQLGYSLSEVQYIERLAVAHGGVRAANLRPGETVVVCPSTGQYSGAVAELAAQMGCQVIALTRSSAKLERIKSLYPERIHPLELSGGDESGTVSNIRALCSQHAAAAGADVVIDISPFEARGSHGHLTAALASLRAGGRAVFLGALAEVKVDYMSLMMRNITIKGQWMYTRSQLLDLIKMIETGLVRLGPSAGHEVVQGGFALEDWEKAISAAEEATSWGQQVLFCP